MAISQSDGSGRGFAAHPYPKANKDGPFNAVFINGAWFWQCAKTRQFATIVGNKVQLHGPEPKRLK